MSEGPRPSVPTPPSGPAPAPPVGGAGPEDELAPAPPSPAGLDRLAGIHDLPVDQQIERYESLHRELTAKLQQNES